MLKMAIGEVDSKSNNHSNLETNRPRFMSSILGFRSVCVDRQIHTHNQKVCGYIYEQAHKLADVTENTLDAAVVSSRQPFYLLYKIDGALQIHTEIYKRPRDSLSFVFFLLEYEHEVVEVLLQFLVRKVDAELFEAVELTCKCKTHRAHEHLEGEKKGGKK